MINFILNMNAAIQTGKDEYPPIPKTKEGLSCNKNNKDLIVESKIFKSRRCSDWQ